MRRFVILLAPWLLVLGACDGESSKTGTGLPDTGLDTGTDTDTDPPPSGEDGTFTFEIDGEYGDTLLLAVPFDQGESGVEVGEPVAAEGVAAASVTLELPAPAAEDLDDFQEGDASLLAAYYAVALVHDADGNGTHDEDEHCVGLADGLLLYLEGEIQEELQEDGFSTGWSVLQWDPAAETEDPVFLDADAVPLEAGLWPVESLTPGGTCDGEDCSEELRLGISSTDDLQDPESATLLLDEPLDLDGDAWEVVLEEPPPEEHLAEVPRTRLETAAEIVFAYQDDGSGGYSTGDTLLYMACNDADLVYLFYYPPASDVETAVSFLETGDPPGWSAQASDAHGALYTLDENQLADLSLSDGCVPERR